MSLQAQPAYTVPEETARVARAIFPYGDHYSRLYDTFGSLFQDQDFAVLFLADGQPALSSVRLMVVLILQVAEGLSDRQAAEAVRTHIDWKYLLCLELDDPGFDASVLSEFRTRLIENTRAAYAEVIGADGLALWQALEDPAAPVWLRQVPAVQILQRVWIQNYTWRDEGTLRWRQTDELPPAALAIRSPYDDEVRFSQKRETTWVGYKVHVTETCDEDAPRLITHVEPTLATTADGQVTTPIHAALQAQDLLPADHMVDTAYLDAELLVASQQDYGVNLVGPPRHDTGWPTRQDGNGFTAGGMSKIM